ncbi:MAG: AMP-binding protein, partial [Marmoricola sp.]
MDAYAIGETTPDLLGETIGASFERTVAEHGDHEALVECASGRRWTYTELDRDVDALARGLLGAGLAKGDRIGVWAPNCAEWTIAQYATAKIGAILVNVNPSYRTHELSYVVNQSGMRMLISAVEFKTGSYREMVEATSDQSPGLDRVVYIGTDDWETLVAEGRDLPEDAISERMSTLEPGDPI